MILPRQGKIGGVGSLKVNVSVGCGEVSLVDRLSPERRSWLMSRVKGRDTTPEMRVRRAAHAIGLRFRLHRKDLPGTPDLIFPKHRIAIFVHGCFWHRHEGCRKASIPKSRPDFWQRKFDSNTARDTLAVQRLEAMGWQVAIIWECETKDHATLTSRLSATFEPTSY